MSDEEKEKEKPPIKTIRKASPARSRSKLPEESKSKIVHRGTRIEDHSSVKFNRYGFGNLNNDINTPADLFELLNARFAFAFDPFPSRVNRPADFDGFAADWRSPAFCNPPYSAIEPALRKAISEMRSERRVKSVFLIPFRPNNMYWSAMVWPHACEIWSFQGRVKFEGYAKALPMPMALVVFDPDRGGSDGATLSCRHVVRGAYAWRELSVLPSSDK